jgi:CelD/BcsL family acetyltransferase involved in cellulose biosynthesis
VEVIKGFATKLEVNEVNTIDGFFGLQECWNKILERSKDNSATLTWEHIFVSAKNLGKNQELRILYVTESHTNRIIAIAPLRKSHYKMRVIRYSVIEPLDYGSATDYTGIILTEKELECIQAIQKYLYLKNDWDFLNLENIPETSTIISSIRSQEGLIPGIQINDDEICPYMEIPDSMDKFLSSLKTNHRRGLRRCLRQLENEHGKVELKEYHELGSLDETMQLFFDLHQKRWKSQGRLGAFNSSKIRCIFLERARLFAMKNWLGLYFLTVNDKPVAAIYALKYNKKISSCASGFDTDYYPYSISNLLLIKIIERGIEQGFNEFDFMKGGEPYKLKWTKKYRQNFSLSLTNKRVSSQLIKLAIKTKKATIDHLF